MARPAPAKRGEIILLALFGSFIVLYLFEVRDVPAEGTILSYLLAPLLIVLLVACAIQAVASRKRSASDEPAAEEVEESLLEDTGEKEAIRKSRLTKTIIMCVVLYACIFLFGFYLGSGLMLLLWFVAFKRLNRTTLVITAAAPLTLYLVFEVGMYFGLYEGIVIEYLKR